MQLWCIINSMVTGKWSVSAGATAAIVLPVTDSNWTFCRPNMPLPPTPLNTISLPLAEQLLLFISHNSGPQCCHNIYYFFFTRSNWTFQSLIGSTYIKHLHLNLSFK
uniref:Uncharacterized protein n=1 Tax=Cacopsylla melanoneura TaxID=428564 RepID=A0A8D9AXG5_9HEMI